MRGLTPDQRDAARLLSGRSGPSVLEKERMLASILDEVAPVAPRRGFGWLVYGGAGLLGLVGAVGALVLVLTPAQRDEFAARGGAQGPQLQVACLDGAKKSDCSAGRTLAFEVAGGAGFEYVALFGMRSDGTVIWYAPEPGEHSAAVPAQARVLPQAAKLLELDAAGPYRIYGVFSKQALDREALKRKLGPELRGDDELRVIVRELPSQGAAPSRGAP